jgi:DNA ligase-1
MLPFWISLIFAVSLCWSTYSFAIKLDTPPLMHSNVYESNLYTTSLYLVSEKLDGVRAYWNGEQLLTRQGYEIKAPDWYVESFPAVPLDGELWIGRGRFDELSGIVRTQQPSNQAWQNIRYVVFDLPAANQAFDERAKALQAMVEQADIPWLSMVEQRSFEDEASLNLYFDQVVASGGEGLMLHRRNAIYSAARVNSLLKYKPNFDDEAIVIAHIEGKGKYTGMMGSVLVEMADGRRFKIGSGFSDQNRENPPPLGATLTFEYSGLTSTGLPRFARFKRIRSE